MREILFRGKRTDNGEWAYGWLSLHNGYPSIWEKDSAHDVRIFEATIGQFTNLYDKTGKNIFEGDILKNVETGEIGYVDYEWHGCPNFVVKTDDGCLHFTTLFIDAPDDNMEIIGNIYDNPELIPVYKAGEYQRY